MILDGNDPSAIAAAARAVRSGALLGLPTETVYGLAADASSDAAVAQIFAAKGRPSDHPLIVHVADAAGIAHFASDVPAFAQKLVDAYWPGPLTLILPRREVVGAVAAGGQNSIGLRCPSHPVAQALLREAGQRGVRGVAAPSANRFGRVSPTTAAHVADEFAALGDDALLILDGGACPVGIESTIVDASRGHPVLMRPGMITPEQLQAACGQPVRQRDEAAPRASGTLASHYAPTAKVRLMDGKMLQTALDVLGKDARHIAVYARTRLRAGPGVKLQTMPADAAACAHELFAVLRELDATGVRLIWVETPPPLTEWDGVRDRLSRAAA